METLNILHGTWLPNKEKNFVNDGKFCVWGETSQLQNNTKLFQYALDKNSLQLIFKEYLNQKILYDEFTKIFQLLPTSNNSFLPSIEILRLINMDVPDNLKLNCAQIDAVAISEPLEFFKQLKLMQLYLPDNIKIGQDLLYWCNFGQILGKILQRDMYIPAFCMKKGINSKNYENNIYSYLQIISQDYEDSVIKYANSMPVMSRGAFWLPVKKLYDPQALIRNFSENMINNIVTRTAFGKKIIKAVEDTFIEGIVDPDNWSERLLMNPYKYWEDTLKQYNMWHQGITVSSTGSDFYLCFKLNAPKEKEDSWYVELLMESKADPSFKIPLAQYWTTLKKDKYRKYLGENIEACLMVLMGQANRIFPELARGLKTATPQGFELTLEEAFTFLKEYGMILQSSGYKVIMPSFLTAKGAQKAKLKLKTESSKNNSASLGSESLFSKKGLIQFNYQLAIGDEEVSAQEWNTLIQAKEPLVMFRGQWIEVNKEQMSEVLDFWQNNKKPQTKKLINILKETQNEYIAIDENASLKDVFLKLYDKDKFSIQKVPKAFKGTLRPYQKRGLSWLQYLENLGLNPCLADDMGLGKTIQIIALLLSDLELNKNNKTLLVVPTSVIGNWQREIFKFAPSIKVLIHHGVLREKNNFKKHLKKVNVIITSFSLIRRDSKIFQDIAWARIVVDEAQNIKNPQSKQTKAINSLSADKKIALTGTPIENRLLDLWSIFSFLNKDYLGNQTKFRKVFEIPIQTNKDPHQSQILKKLTEPFILRRLKTDKAIIKDLPDKQEQIIYSQLTKEQAALYQNVVNEIKETMTKHVEDKQRQAIILSSLMKLKQICNHPVQFLQDGSEFSIKRSYKLSRLMAMAEEIMLEGDSMLVFTQFTEIGSELTKLFRHKNYNTYYLHGGTSKTARDRMIAQFQNPDTSPSIFVLSLKAGGVGINLTKANYVFHFDRWWNPAVENQATDRAYRIGQSKTVFVNKFLTVGTLEERINDMIEKKGKISSSVIGTSENWLQKLDNKTLIDLIQLRQEAIMDGEDYG